MNEDELIFVGATMLLAQMVGQKREPANNSEIQTAVNNAHNLHEEVRKRRETITKKEAYERIDHLKEQGG